MCSSSLINFVVSQLFLLFFINFYLISITFYFKVISKVFFNFKTLFFLFLFNETS